MRVAQQTTVVWRDGQRPDIPNIRESQKSRTRGRDEREKVRHLRDDHKSQFSPLPVEMYPGCETKWSLQHQLSTLMCISTSSRDVNPASFSLSWPPSIRGFLCRVSWITNAFPPGASLSVIAITRKPAGTNVQSSSREAHWRVYGVCTTATEQTGESANVSLLQSIALPTLTSVWAMVAGCSYIKAGHRRPYVCIYTVLKHQIHN